MAHDDDDFEEYAEERPERVGGSHRLLIITLSVGCVALAVSNVLLAMRVSELRRASGPERPVVASATADAAAPAPPRVPEASAPAASIPSQTAPTITNPAPDVSAPVARPPATAGVEAPAPASLPPVATPPERVPPAREPQPVASARERAAADLPPRSTSRVEPRDGVAGGAPERPPLAASSRERMTASWMVQEHGRHDAELRARAVADFYDAQSPEGRYWRRVLGEIVTARP